MKYSRSTVFYRAKTDIIYLDSQIALALCSSRANVQLHAIKYGHILKAQTEDTIVSHSLRFLGEWSMHNCVPGPFSSPSKDLVSQASTSSYSKRERGSGKQSYICLSPQNVHDTIECDTVDYQIQAQYSARVGNASVIHDSDPRWQRR